MGDRSIFEILGPVMVGPSSSHTAGAVRIGRIARAILEEKPVQATIILYGSFAKTYKGHGTDRALIGGLLGMDTDDERIREALGIALKEGLIVTFETRESSQLHPNTAEIHVSSDSGKSIFIQGSSVGGGNILISRINEFEVNVYGRYSTMLIEHEDKPGVIGRVTTILGINAINIGAMRMARNKKGDHNFMVIETDEGFSSAVLESIKNMQDIINAIKVDPI